MLLISMKNVEIAELYKEVKERYGSIDSHIKFVRLQIKICEAQLSALNSLL
jgi:hypothetical protein